MHTGSLLEWLNFIVLFLTLVCVGWYLRETHKMRKAAEQQVKGAHEQLTASHAQVQASQRQVTAAFDQIAAMRQQTAVALDQLEGQIRPALVVRVNNHGVELVNIGSGPALHVQLSPTDKGRGAYLAVHPFPEPHDPIPFLEVGQTRQTIVQCVASPHFPGAPVLNDRSLQCTYKSLSGRVHYTVVDFTGTNVDDTRFYEYEPGE
jgi:Flp pilus assembly protein TadG